MLDLKGIYPPLPTSFDSRGNLALAKMQKNLACLSAFDLQGFLVLGSNGEMVMLSETEKKKVYEACRKAIPENKIMLAGTGAQSTRESIRLTKAAASYGADAALVLNPYYYKGLMSKQALLAHYFAVADASEIPIILYNMPANSGLDMDAALIAEISAHPNILGLKDSGADVVKMGEIRRTTAADFQLLAGSAGFLLPALSIGATGGILALANIAPQQCISLYQHFLNGNIEKAREIQLKLIPLNMLVTSKYGVPALKEAMDYIGLYGGNARSPILPLTEEARKHVHTALIENTIKKIENT